MILILACINTLTTCESNSNIYVSEQRYEYRIERANLCSDLARIADTINSAYKRHPFNREDRLRITVPILRTLILDDENKLYLAVSGKNEICGTVLLHHSEISLLSVHPDSQRQGLGLKLLQNAEAEAFKTFKSVFLKVIPLFQENLIRYYESAGYKSFGEYDPLSQEKLNRIQEQYHDKVSALILRKENPAISN